MASEIKNNCIISIDCWVINEVLFEGIKYGFASCLPVLEDFDVLFGNFERIDEEVVEAVAICHATPELTRTRLLTALIQVDSYQQCEDRSIYGAIHRFSKADGLFEPELP
jgi:hypothetical protein